MRKTNITVNKMSSQQDHVIEVLKRWYKAKQEIANLEKDCLKYKQFIGKVMDNRNTNVISRGGYVANRRHDSRTILSKSSVPKEVWDKYSTVTYYDSYYVKKQTPSKK